MSLLKRIRCDEFLVIGKKFFVPRAEDKEFVKVVGGFVADMQRRKKAVDFAFTTRIHAEIFAEQSPMQRRLLRLSLSYDVHGFRARADYAIAGGRVAEQCIGKEAQHAASWEVVTG